MTNFKNIISDLQKLKNPEKVKILQRFFKTGKGEYGEGDVFLGIIVPLQRCIAKKYKNLSLSEIQKLLVSKVHEHRLTALFILVDQYKNADEKGKKEIFEFYLENIKNINNWDLVDLSAPNIVGEYLYHYRRGRPPGRPAIGSGQTGRFVPTEILNKLVSSPNLWSRRIAVLSTHTFICNHKYEMPIALYEKLLKDKEDLIHKSVGWMLREIGKRDLQVEVNFLEKYYKQMPRTMLRYAIEKFDEEKRSYYLKN
jgi:3-methyladenine DNA glycosylase AlkD